MTSSPPTATTCGPGPGVVPQSLSVSQIDAILESAYASCSPSITTITTTTSPSVESLSDDIKQAEESIEQCIDKSCQSVAIAKTIAAAEREQICGDFISSMNCFYGEMPLQTLVDIIQECKLTPTQLRHYRFLDLGSGSGKVLLAASMQFEFESYIGIELLPGLHKLALDVQQSLTSDTKERQCGLDEYAQLRERVASVQFDCDSFLKRNAAFQVSKDPAPDTDCDTASKSQSQCTHVFTLACSTAFDEKLMKGITARAERMPVGSYLITVSNKVKSIMLTLHATLRKPMSWGEATIYIYKKSNNRQLETMLMRSIFRT
jgi:Histone methylation protein DOT1